MIGRSLWFKFILSSPCYTNLVQRVFSSRKAIAYLELTLALMAEAIWYLDERASFWLMLPILAIWAVAQTTPARLVIDTINGWAEKEWEAAGYKVYRLGVGSDFAG